MDDFTQVTYNSWFSRITDSIKGVLVGLLLMVVSVLFMFWNEKNSVTTTRSLKEGAKQVVSIEPQSVDTTHQGQLVHVTGDANASEILSDPKFGISSPNALRLTRVVTMYQWQEDQHTRTEKEFGGATRTETSYSYRKDWFSQPINSIHFQQPGGHENPSSMLAAGQSFNAANPTLGAFKLPASILEKLRGDVAVDATEADLAKLPPDLKDKAKINSGAFYFGNDPANPQIGDQKVTFKVVRPGTISIIAVQKGDSFEPYVAKAGGTIERVEMGAMSADAMFHKAQSENDMGTWLFRFIGFFLMSFGIGLIIRPLVVVADVVPFIGNILGAGVFVAALGLGLIGSLVVIALAWIAVRPLVGGGLLVVAIVGFILASQRGKTRRMQAGAAV